MRSRFCRTFVPYQSQSVQVNQEEEQQQPKQTQQQQSWNQRNLNFTILIWQPFLDLENVATTDGINQTKICGPLLNLVAEIANSIQANLTYLPDTTTTAQMNPIEQGLAHFLIQPMFSSALGNLSRMYRLSSQLGETSMVSILSAQHRLPDGISVGSFSSIINLPFVRLYFAFFVLIHFTSFAVCPYEFLHHRFLSNQFRILLHQPAIGQWFTSPNRLSRLSLNLIVLTFFFNQFVSNTFLNLFTIGPKWDRIDHLDDLVKRPHIKLATFDGDITVELFRHLSQQLFYQNFDGRQYIPNPSHLNEDNYHRWEPWAVNEIAHDRMALIGDKCYLDFLFAKYRSLPDYSNLYRSRFNQFTFPYFLAFRWNQHSMSESELLQKQTNFISSNLVESGIFDFWIKETLFMNRPPGLAHHHRDHYEYSAESPHHHGLAQTIHQFYQQLSVKDIQVIFELYLLFCLVGIGVWLAELAHRPSCAILHCCLKQTSVLIRLIGGQCHIRTNRIGQI